MADKTGDLIICPYCDSIHRDMCEYPEGVHLGNETDMECWECGKSFSVIAESSWTFNTYKKKERAEKRLDNAGCLLKNTEKAKT